MQMSRDSRAVKEYLEGKSGQPTPPFDLFLLEQLTYSYYPKIIKSTIDRMYNPNSKKDPSSINFYDKPIRSLNKARRNSDNWFMDESARDVVWKISHYLLTDYNSEQQAIIKKMSEIYTPQQIQKAIDSAVHEKIYNVNYLEKIAEGIKAVDDKRKHEINKMRDMFVDGDVNSETVKHSPLEMASMIGEFENELENAILRSKLENLTKSNKQEGLKWQ